MSPERRRRLGDVVTAELVRHFMAEQRCLYPTARRVLRGRGRTTMREHRERIETERALRKLGRMNPAKPEFSRQFETVIRMARRHMRNEEQNLFPTIRTTCSPHELRELGHRVRIVMDAAPTRPHPEMPNQPILLGMLSPYVGFMDKILDLMTGRPTSRRERRRRHKPLIGPS